MVTDAKIQHANIPLFGTSAISEYFWYMKIQTIIAALLFFPAFILHADETTIIVNNVNNNTRSIVEVPEASISHEVLRVSFSSSGIYSLTVSDSFGVPVYISSLPADGMEYSYDLSGIGEGTFTLTLEGPSGEYEGHITIHK